MNLFIHLTISIKLIFEFSEHYWLIAVHSIFSINLSASSIAFSSLFIASSYILGGLSPYDIKQLQQQVQHIMMKMMIRTMSTRKIISTSVSISSLSAIVYIQLNSGLLNLLSCTSSLSSVTIYILSSL